MKKFLNLSVYLFVVFFIYPVFSQTNIIGPPKGLEYGMTYSEVKTTLKSEKIKLSKPKHEKKWKLPKGFKISKVGKYKIFDKKTFDNYACFNASGELCAFQINFRWFASGENAAAESRGDAIRFWSGEMEQAFNVKYSGEGFEKHNDPDPDGNIPLVAFRDEIGNEVGVYLLHSKTLLGYQALLIIYYNNEEILSAKRKDLKSTDKF